MKEAFIKIHFIIKKSVYILYLPVLAVFFSRCDVPEKKPTPIFQKEKLRKVDGPGLFSNDPNQNWRKVKAIDSMNQRAIASWKVGNHKQALDQIKQAYKKAIKTNNEKAMAKVLNTLGLIYWRLENNSSAMASYKEAAKLAKKHNLHRLLGLTHTNQALILKANGKFNQAFSHNNKAIEIFRKNKLYRDLGIALNNQGQIFKNQKRIDSAQHYYRLALKNYKKDNYKNGMAATYYNLSETYMWEDLERASLDAAKKSLSLSLETSSKVRTSEAYKRLSETYEYFGNPDSALKYYKIHSAKKIAMLLENQRNKLAKYQAKIGAELKELQIENLKKEKELLTNKIWFYAIGFGVLLLIGAFFIYRYLTKIKYKKHKLEITLKNSKKIIQVKEQELKGYILDLAQKNKLIKKLQGEFSKNKNPNDRSGVAELLKQKILTEEDWQTFKIKFKEIYPDFFDRMGNFETTLTEAEIRYLVLLRLEISSKEMAGILGISPQSVRVCKMRLKKKLKKEGFPNVEGFLEVLVN